MQRTFAGLVVVALVVGLAFMTGRWSAPTGESVEFAEDEVPAALEWTCPMHPEVRLPEPGPCPSCGMELVAFDPSMASAPGSLKLTPEALALAGIRTAEVRRAPLERAVRLIGQLERDETTLRTVSANVPGRIERLFVDRIGVEVDAGEHLFEIYSPSLYSAQQELVQVLQRIDERGGNTGAFADQALDRSYRGARDKLILYGLDPDQIARIEETRDADQRIEVRSPVDGTVVERHLEQGDYVMVGDPIYELAGLDRLWLELEAHEQDLPWLAYGQDVTATFEALPGEVVSGQVAFLDPELDPNTRTVSLRVHVHDTTGRLRPGMFASATVLSELDAGGEVVGPDLSGLWVSPMHPEIVSDRPGVCTVCGMDLVPAETLGLTGRGLGGLPLAVPSTAVLQTGRRAVVYVEQRDAETPTFELREIVLGPRAEDHFVVLDGLEPGERVVVEGAFRIDSEMQIRGGPSMLSMPPDPGPGAGPDGAAFRATLAPTVKAYLDLQAALADDDDSSAMAAALALTRSMSSIEPGLLPRRAVAAGRAAVAELLDAGAQVAQAVDIGARREAFERLSLALGALVERFGAPVGEALVEMYCPMAFDDAGAAWLQRDQPLANPYFGASMLRCGERRRVFTPAEGDVGATGLREDVEVEPIDSGDETVENSGAEAAEAPVVITKPAPAVETGAPDHSELWQLYLDAAVALAADDAVAARAALDLLPDAARRASSATNEERLALETFAAVAEAVRPSPAIASLREDFEPVSDAARALLEVAGNRSGATLRVAYCPMAFDDRGARWVQADDLLANPYFGAMMLRCGSFEDEVSSR